MGNKCCNGASEQYNVVIEKDENLGKDEENVTENFQFHRTYIKTNKIKLHLHDQMLRNYCNPLYLMQAEKVLADLIYITD